MSSGTKIYKYRCSTCQREVELVSDNRRPDPLRCTITDQCRGFLDLVSKRRGDRPRMTVQSSTLEDRKPRGLVGAVEEAPADPVLVSITSFNSMSGMTMATVMRTVDGVEAVFSVKDVDGNIIELERGPISRLYPTKCSVNMLVYELTADVLTAQKYTFIFNGTAQLIEGVDDSKEQRLLRFGSGDNVTVFANGVKLEPSQYDRSVDDVLTLTPLMIGSEIALEVYVYRDRQALINESSIIRLTFNPLSETDEKELALRSGCAWGDVARVNMGVDRSLLFCTNMASLETRKTYAVARFEAVADDYSTCVVETDEVHILLSDAPHSFIDRRVDAILEGQTLVTDKFTFSYDLSEATGDMVPVVSENTLSVLPQRLNPKAEANVMPVSTVGTERSFTKRAEAFIIGPA